MLIYLRTHQTNENVDKAWLQVNVLVGQNQDRCNVAWTQTKLLSRVTRHVSRTQDAHGADGGQDDALRPPVHQGGDGLGVKVEVGVGSERAAVQGLVECLTDVLDMQLQQAVVLAQAAGGPSVLLDLAPARGELDAAVEWSAENKF